MLPQPAQFITIILTMIGLVGCTQKYDYNAIIGMGLIYLSSKHGYLYNLPSFYVLIGCTIIVDMIQIIAVTNQAVLMRFIITILQILCKIGIIVLLKISANKNNKAMAVQAVTNPQPV